MFPLLLYAASVERIVTYRLLDTATRAGSEQSLQVGFEQCLIWVAKSKVTRQSMKYHLDSTYALVYWHLSNDLVRTLVMRSILGPALQRFTSQVEMRGSSPSAHHKQDIRKSHSENRMLS